LSLRCFLQHLQAFTVDAVDHLGDLESKTKPASA
jgi:hypothetical protein